MASHSVQIRVYQTIGMVVRFSLGTHTALVPRCCTTAIAPHRGHGVWLPRVAMSRNLPCFHESHIVRSFACGSVHRAVLRRRVQRDAIPTVYFLRRASGGPIKIGYTARRGDARRTEAQVFHAEVIDLLAEGDGTLETERALHAYFAPYHVAGEWFEPCEELLDLIDAVRDGVSIRVWARGLIHPAEAVR